MNVLNRWTGLVAALAAAVPLAIATSSASAAPVRTATTTSYTDATFLQHALGLPASDTDPVIESVTLDRFQWLLQQPGKFAVLVGDPAEDSTFSARAQDVEFAAKAAGVKKVYWFDPNLSGNAKVGSLTEPTLDIRNPAGIGLPTVSQNIYGSAWLYLVSLLGDGVDATVVKPGMETSTISVTKQGQTATTLNDYGYTVGASTKVGAAQNGGALYDYRNGTPANASDSFFFIYNKDNTAAGGQPQRIVAWTDLTQQTSSNSTKADVTTAIGAGAASLTELDQFAWWKSEINAKQVTQAPAVVNGSDTPVLTDADNAAADGGWRIDQITYPELVDLLKNATDGTAAILFGGTWCPNTRPVIGSVNKYAQQNNVHVFNFDTVLDGGLAGGSTTDPVNPLQVRNTVDNRTTTLKANPTSLYGDVVSQYLTNIKTEYNPANTPVTYYKGGDTTGTQLSINKLQVPFVIGYQGKPGDAPNGGVNRQWIIDKGNNTYTEYMSQWWFTNPRPSELGLAETQLPALAPIWSTINAELAGFTWQTDPTTLLANTGVDTDDAQYLVDADKANVTYSDSGSGSVSVSFNAGGSVVISPAALSGALSALGAAAPVNYQAARTAYIAARKATTQDPALISNLTTVVGAWGVAQTRKSKVNSTWGTATSPGSVAGGLAAVHALDVFFGGLPGGVVSTQSVTAPDVAAGTAPTVSVSIANDFGRNPTGNVSLVVSKGGATVATASAAVANGAASFTLPALDAGTYDYTLSYAGDDQILAFTKTGSFTVSPAVVNPIASPAPIVGPAPVVKPITIARIKASKLAGSVSKRPTSRKTGKYKVTITAPKGHAAATGKVTIKLKKGKTTKTLTGKLSHGVVTLSVPKLAKGTWKVSIAWAGDANYLAGSATAPSIKVTK